MRRGLSGLEVPEGTCVAVMGSLGRAEMTSGSDVDYAILGPQGDPAEDFREQVTAALHALGHRPPGVEGPFARTVSVDDLVSRIGLDPDVNRSLTQRMLLLLESVAVCGDDGCAAAKTVLLRRYLGDRPKSHQPPRFLLNDVIRYWRTVAIDYEGKMERRKGAGWAIRNAKLRLSRKMLFAGGLLPVLRCSAVGADEMPAFLEEQLAQPPVDRVAAAFLEHSAVEPGGRALLAYSQFLDILDDAGKREELEAMDPDRQHRTPLWREVESLAAAFQRGLDALLFDTSLHATARQYSVF